MKTRSTSRHHRLWLLAWLWLFAVACFAAEQDVGIILMHGKWARGPANVMKLARELEGAGYRVALPTMPWAGTRNYDVPYPQALAEIEATANGLREKGAARIVVGGLSFGANGALAYAASGKRVDAIFVLSPGHVPERGAFRKAVEQSVARARSMIDAGNGKGTASFEDRNQGRSRQVRASAEAYFSYFDPDGLGSMTKTAAAVPAGIPVFMAAGSGDAISTVAKESIFDRAPGHDRSVYTIVAADHAGVADMIGPALIAWLRSLGY